MTPSSLWSTRCGASWGYSMGFVGPPQQCIQRGLRLRGTRIIDDHHHDRPIAAGVANKAGYRTRICEQPRLDVAVAGERLPAQPPSHGAVEGNDRHGSEEL